MSNERVDRIEERVAWLEHHVTAQDKAMLELHEDLARLRKEITALRERAESTANLDLQRAPDSERPPHY
ncbi:MAG TPA: SlyX family protein [Opitutaceae bacterium]|nr:SlyX family protein [Opitutaceae bacterium]